jgi:hypothetical protein
MCGSPEASGAATEASTDTSTLAATDANTVKTSLSRASSKTLSGRGAARAAITCSFSTSMALTIVAGSNVTDARSQHPLRPSTQNKKDKKLCGWVDVGGRVGEQVATRKSHDPEQQERDLRVRARARGRSGHTGDMFARARATKVCLQRCTERWDEQERTHPVFDRTTASKNASIVAAALGLVSTWPQSTYHSRHVISRRLSSITA